VKFRFHLDQIISNLELIESVLTNQTQFWEILSLKKEILKNYYWQMNKKEKSENTISLKKKLLEYLKKASQLGKIEQE